jgi:hypothetical protein
MLGIYQDFGIRFEYPPDWEIEVTEDGPRTTIAIHAPTGLAFAMVTLDTDCPEPAELADEALEAMKEEYPGLDVREEADSLAGYDALGYDLEFFSLDLASACAIRCYRSERQTALFFAQWTELDGEEPEAVLSAVRRSLEEVSETVESLSPHDERF